MKKTEAERRVLAAIARAAARQRAAILARDVRSLNRLFDRFSQLQSDLSALIAGLPVEREPEGRKALAGLARQLREELLLNRALLGNGVAIADHFMACLGAAAPGAPAAGAVPWPSPDAPSAP